MHVDLGRGLVVPNPVGVASGTFGYGFECAQFIDIQRIGALYTKGTTLHPRNGNPPPRIAETAFGMLNSIGLQNPGIDHVVREYAPQFAQWKVPVILNIAGGSLDEFVAITTASNHVAGIAGIELNISCPNIAKGLDFGTDAAAAARVTAAVRAATGHCVIVKLSPNVADIGTIARAVEGAGADAISAVNTYLGMKVNSHLRRPVLPRGTGGMSGPAIKPLALAAVAAIRATVRIPVIGVGGIASLSDALEFFIAGADAIQVGTANFVSPSVSLDIATAFEEYAAAHRLAAISDLRGVALTPP